MAFKAIVALALCAPWLVACGDDATVAPRDAGPDQGSGNLGGDFVIAPPAQPVAPAPVARACPGGFRATSDGYCDPFPAGVLECGAGEQQLPGEESCARLGPACPEAGAWAADLPATGTVRFVRAGAPLGGDGSRGAPYPTIGDANRLSNPGDTIAVSRGTYDEAVVLRAGVKLHGACATGTTIAPSFGAGKSLSTAGLAAVARNVTLSGRGAGVSLGGTGKSLHLENVVVRGNFDFGVRVFSGAELTANGLIIADTRPTTRGGGLGRGLDVEDGATVDVRRALLDGNTDFGIFGAFDVELRLTDIVVRNTRPQESDGAHGRALSLSRNSGATIARAVFEDNTELGALFQGEGTRATIEDTVIRRVEVSPHPRGAGTGTCLSVEVGAVVTAHGLRVEDCHFGAITVLGAGSTFEGEDITIARIAPDGVGDLGIGVATERGATARLTRTVIRDTHTLAISVKDADSRLTADDLSIKGVSPRAMDGELGAGIGLIRGAQATISRVHVEATTDHGLFVSGVDSHVTLTDATIIRGEVSASTGVGVLVRDGAALDGARIEVLDMAQAGLLVGSNDARVEVRDLTIRRVPERLIPEYGVLYAAGIQVDSNATAILTRVLVEEAAQRGISTLNGELTITDGVVRSMVEDSAGELGHGIEADLGAQVSLERVAVRRAFTVGVVALAGAHIVARGLEVVETYSRTSDGHGGEGVVAQSGGFIELENARLEDNREVALLALGPHSRVDASRITIYDVSPNGCGEDGSCSAGGGFGAAAVEGTLTLTNFLIEGGALGGLQVASGAAVDLAHGSIIGHPVGINIQDAPDYDFARLMNDVRFVDNQRNLDVDLIPIPDASLDTSGRPITPTETPE